MKRNDKFNPGSWEISREGYGAATLWTQGTVSFFNTDILRPLKIVSSINVHFQQPVPLDLTHSPCGFIHMSNVLKSKLVLEPQSAE